MSERLRSERRQWDINHRWLEEVRWLQVCVYVKRQCDV